MLFDLGMQALAPAISSGVGEAALQSITPTLTDAALNAGVDSALAGMLPNQLGNATAGLGLDSVFQTLGQGMPIQNGFTMAGNEAGGLFGDWGSRAMDMLGNEQVKNFTTLGSAGLNAMNNANALSNAKQIQQEQLAMSKDAYNRDREADQRRQKLVF